MKTLGSGFVSGFPSSFPGVSSFAFGHSSVRLYDRLMLSGRISGMTLCSERACFVACVFDIVKVRVCLFKTNICPNSCNSDIIISPKYYRNWQPHMPEKLVHYEQSRIMHIVFGSDPLSLLPSQVVATDVAELFMVSDADMQARWMPLSYD